MEGWSCHINSVTQRLMSAVKRVTSWNREMVTVSGDVNACFYALVIDSFLKLAHYCCIRQDMACFIRSEIFVIIDIGLCIES